MKDKKPRHPPRRLRARPLLVAAALTLATASGCNEFEHGTPAQQLDLSAPDLPPALDLGLPGRD
jgi:hypothetical protein